MGRRPGRGQRRDEGSARRQGCGPRRDDDRRPSDPAGIHDHDRGVQRLLRSGRAAPRRPLGRRPRGDARGRAAVRQGLRRCPEPAPGLGPVGGEVLDARDDGHRPEPRPQRRDAAGPDRAHRQRALRLGRVSPLHRDVRADRHGRRRQTLRRAARGDEEGPRRGCRHGPQGRRPGRARRRLQEDRQGRDRPRLSDRPLRAARSRHQGRLRFVVRPAGTRLPREPEDRSRPRDRGQRRDDGLRQHGRRLGHGRRLHPRPEHRRADPLRRVPH